MWPDRTHPMLSAESSCVCMPKFQVCSPIHFSGKSTIFGFFEMQKRAWPYRYIYDVPLVTLILNIYGFVVMTSTIQVRIKDT